MSESYRPPKTYDHVEAPDGHGCQMYRDEGGDMVPCYRDADVLVVYEGNVNPEIDTRRNVLACLECAPISEDEAAEYRAQVFDDA